MSIVYYSEEGLKNLKKRLNYLKTEKRQEVIDAISDAREKGDLKENSEYDAAKDAQAKLELEIKKLEKEIGNARVKSSKDIDISIVDILSKVTVLNKKIQKEFTYEIVAEHEVDLLKDKISSKSPIAKALIGKKVGDSVLAEVPAGTLNLEILKIEY